MAIVMRLGTIPVPPQAEARVAALARSLGELFGVDMELHRAADYRVLLAAMDQGAVHFAWMPPIPASRGLASGTVVPAAVAVRNGLTSYMTGLIALKSSGIDALSDLKKVRAAWVDRESAGGYLVIRAALRNAGVSLVGAFSEETFLRSHAEVARCLMAGKADVGGTYFTFASGSQEIARSGYLEADLAHDDVRMLAHAGPIPSDVIAAQRSVPPSLVAALQAALVDGRALPVLEAARALTQADGFQRPAVEHFVMLREVLAVFEGGSPSSTVPRSR